jgi:fatty-acyl-CoA synthase
VGAITLTPRELAVEFPEKCGRGGIFTEIATIDADGNRTPAGVPGEIILRGPTLMKGYWNNPDATAEVMMPDGWMRTGDMGVLDEQGHLTFVSRLKDIIISGGLNISAAEVERVIGEIEDVLEVVVFGMPDPKFGETPMAVVHSTREIAADMVVEHCRGKLADYKVPREAAAQGKI